MTEPLFRAGAGGNSRVRQAAGGEERGARREAEPGGGEMWERGVMRDDDY